VKLHECLSEKTIEVRSGLKDRDAVLSKLTGLLLAPSHFMDAETLLAEMQAREKLGSTGIGEGVAIPHVHLKGIRGLNVAMMTLENAIDFGAIDDQPCFIFIMVVGPDDDRDAYLKLLSEVSRMLHHESARKSVLAAATPAELLKVLRESDVS